MPIRQPCNTNFYAAAPGRCRQWVDELTATGTQDTEVETVVAGLVPHAGWFYSGSVAGRVWKALAGSARPAQTIVLFGSVHYLGVTRCAAYPSGAWETPLGAVEVDGDLAAAIAAAHPDLLELRATAHDDEHSLEVQVPFIRALLPGARILPIATPPGARTSELGAAIGGHVERHGLDVVAVGSTDLTHYGVRYGFAPAGAGPEADAWMRANDRRVLRLVEELDIDAIHDEVAEHHNACGPGAVTATLAFARARGAESGRVLEYRTSHDVTGEPDFEMAVGYAGVVFGRGSVAEPPR